MSVWAVAEFKVTEPAANWTESPFTTPVMLEVSAPCRYRSGVPAVSHASMLGIADQVPVADHVIRSELDRVPVHHPGNARGERALQVPQWRSRGVPCLDARDSRPGAGRGPRHRVGVGLLPPRRRGAERGAQRVAQRGVPGAVA